MSLNNFYNNENEYLVHEGKAHYNLGNKIVHSDMYKKMNPLRQIYEYQPGQYQ